MERVFSFNSSWIPFLFFVNSYQFTVSPTGNLQYLYTSVSPQIQEAAAQGVVQRLFPSRFAEFSLKVDGSLTNSSYEDAFEISFDAVEKRVEIIGTTGVSAVYGLNFYLKYFCNVQISWDGNQVSLPQSLPHPATIKTRILDRFRYYENVCTESYSFVWWDWSRWEAEIDWMALNGINLPIAFTGQEAIWSSVYSKLGLSTHDINAYLTGPAYLAWWRMGNLQSWGGPMSEYFVQVKLALLQQILERMRSLGMLPVLPAFAGQVPRALLNLFPNATFEQHPSWNNFNSSYSETFMLDPRDPLFHRVEKLFIDELTSAVGTDHIYSADAYNENRPASNDTDFLQAVAQSTFASMMAADSKAVWMMQAWVFTDFGFWNNETVRAFLGGVEIGNLLILDLQAESMPLFVAFDSFFNHSFIWCMLHNFGGTMNFYGNMDVINNMLPTAREVAARGTLVGIGLTPEGINQNYVMYDYMTQMTVHNDPISLQKWVQKYSQRRYGFESVILEAAWQILRKGVYNNLIPGYRNHGRTILNHRPRINATEELWYDPEDISTALAYFLVVGIGNPSAMNSSLYKHDTVDLTRQFCIHLGTIGYWNMMQAYNEGDIETFWKESVKLLQLLDDFEELLATNKKFLLGKWTQAAESWGSNEQEKTLLRFNSLDQITTWGPNGEIVDYAAKQWAGVISDYIKPRWALFIDSLEESLFTSQPFNETEFKRRVLAEVELPFTKSTKAFPTLPAGDSLQVALRIYKQWRRVYVNGCRKWKNAWTMSRDGPFLDPHNLNLAKTFGTVAKLKEMVVKYQH